MNGMEWHPNIQILLFKKYHIRIFSQNFCIIKKNLKTNGPGIQIFSKIFFERFLLNITILKKSKDEWCSKSNIIKNITNQNFSQILENFLLNITMNGIELQIYKLHYHIIKINKMLIKLQNIKFSML